VRGEGQKKDLDWLRKISSFLPARVILTANNYRVFDLLEGKGKNAAAVAKALSCDRRAMELLLNSLASIGLLRKKGSFYSNMPVASRYLVSGKPEYQGNILRHYDTLWENWSGLDNVVKTGEPSRRAHEHESFILGMHDLASLKVGELMKHVDLKAIRSVLDLGGGPGTYSMAFARKKRDVTLFDSSETLKISKRLIADSGLKDRIRLLPGDFTKDDLGGTYDMVFLSQILHAYGPESCASLLKKIYRALNADGRAVVQEFYLDETKASPPQGALFAINMLVNTPLGRTYTPKEISGWMRKAGFTKVDIVRLAETVLITGRKSRRRK
jgi:SAM-dependent methyltransferase